MSIFTSWYENVVAWQHNRYDKRLKEGWQRIMNDLAFNPEYNRVSLAYMTPQRRTLKLVEYNLWSMGDEELIREYYTKRGAGIRSINGTYLDLNLFWEKAKSNHIMVHTGFPGLISTKMSEIKFSHGYDIIVEVFKKIRDELGTEKVSKNINEEESDRIRDLLTDVLLQMTSFDEKLDKMGYDESWSGHTSLRFAFERAITPYPILEAFDARYFSVLKKRGHTISITYHQWANIGESGSEKKYRLDETYTTIRDESKLGYYNQWRFDNDSRSCALGDAVIEYYLYELKGGKEILIPINNWKLCPPLTDGLVDTTNNYYEAISFPGLQGMIAFEKANKLPNPDFPNSPYGSSDYARCVVSFDKLDELYSENAREVRDNKTKECIPISMMPKDKDGKLLMRDPFQTNILIGDENDIDQTQGAQPQKYGVIQIQDKTDSIQKKWMIEVNQICTNAGISPTSLGIYGFESISSSDKSQQEREKSTIGTRKKSLEKWGPYLENIFLQLLIFNTWLWQHYGAAFAQPGIESMDIDFSNCNVKIEFPDYVQASQKERMDMWGIAKTQGIADTRMAVKKSYPDMASDEIDDLVARIQMENGLSTDNPNALNMNNMIQPIITPPGGETK